MNLTSIGDMALSFAQRTRSAQLKSTMTRLTEELSSGQVQDISARLGGDYSHLIDIDHTMRRLDGFAIASSEAALFAKTAQEHLQRMQGVSGELSLALLSAGQSSLPEARDHAALTARTDLEVVTAALNGGAAGRSLFAGIATDRAALASADDLLAALKPQVNGLATADDIIQAAKAWFDDPAGFQATIYSGATDDLAPIEVGAGQSVALSMRADDAEFRDLLRHIAVAALATDPDLALTDTTQTELLRRSGENLLGVQDRLTGLQSDLGFAEARIDEATTRNAAARTSLDYARAELLEADPFETATRLEDVQFRLESLYAVTVRTANLSLVNFLR